MTTLTREVPETKTQVIQEHFNVLKANQYVVGQSTFSERKKKLKSLLKAIMKYRPEIKEAMFKDFRKHPTEVDLTEVYPITNELKSTIKNMRYWMADKSVPTPITMMGSSSYIRHEPKGVVLIISPWNFPINLTFGPMIGAIAAGNCVMVKPSENTPFSSAIMKKIIDEVFDNKEVVMVEGGVETATSLLALPFNHIHFTGAPSIGKIVMAAAAKNLSSVTLELGGKSPTIVDETADLTAAARRIAWGKYMNNGQICITPDYVYVHESVKEKFLEKVKEQIKTFYTEDPSSDKSYARMVNRRHYNRVTNYIEDAVLKGANLRSGGKLNEEENFIEPVIMDKVDDSMLVMQEEIFGPILPVMTYSSTDSIIKKINAGEKPLALYIYSKNKKNINHIIDSTRAGGTCINQNCVHFFNTNLPFGGSNNSGIGKSRGKFGFDEFSNARGVLKQHTYNATDLLMPPYNNFKQKLIDLTIKYL